MRKLLSLKHLVVSLGLILLLAGTSWGATTGPKYPTLGETVSEGDWSDNTWVNPTNIYTDDAATASVTHAQFDSPDQTYVLKATGFDFSSIPSDATINGVICRVNTWYRPTKGSGSMDLMQLLDVDKARVGTNQCATPVALTTDASTVIAKGASSDEWGNDLTVSWVQNSNFGVGLGVLATAANADVDVDYISLEVYYTPANSHTDSVVLIPDADGAFNTFDSSSAGAAHWTCVNDSCSDANRCDTDTSAKLYTYNGLEQYRITNAPPADTLNPCDSMAIYCNWAEQRSGTSGEWKVFFGWRYKEEGSWYYCQHQGGTDTLIINSSTCTVYRKSWIKNPYYSDADPYGISWYWYAGYLDDEDAGNAFQPAFGVITGETGCFATTCIVAMFDVWIVFYYTVIEEAEGNPRRNRIIRQMLRGETDEKMDFYARLDPADYRQ